MSPAVRKFLQRWFITTLAVLVAANVVNGIGYQSIASLFVASLLLGILNAFLRPIMLVLSLPLLLLSLGLFALVINALLFYFVGWLVKGFTVENFRAAFRGSLVVSFTSMVANGIFGANKPPQSKGDNDRRPPPARDGGGPVIDV